MIYELNVDAELNVVYVNVGTMTPRKANLYIKKLQKTWTGKSKVLFLPTRYDKSPEEYYKTTEYISLVDVGNLPQSKVNTYVKKYAKKFKDLGFDNITFLPVRS